MRENQDVSGFLDVGGIVKENIFITYAVPLVAALVAGRALVSGALPHDTASGSRQQVSMGGRVPIPVSLLKCDADESCAVMSTENKEKLT